MDDVARTGCTRHGRLAPMRRCDRAAWRLVAAFAIVAAQTGEVTNVQVY